MTIKYFIIQQMQKRIIRKYS